MSLTLIRVASQLTLKEWLVGILIPTDVGLLTLIRVASQPTLKEWLVGILIPTDVGLFTDYP